MWDEFTKKDFKWLIPMLIIESLLIIWIGYCLSKGILLESIINSLKIMFPIWIAFCIQRIVDDKRDKIKLKKEINNLEMVEIYINSYFKNLNMLLDSSKTILEFNKIILKRILKNETM